MSMTMEEENIKVAVRIRPMQTAERKEGDIPCVKASADGKEVQVKVGPLDASSYRCNQCFANDTTQAEFFNECGITELLDSSMKGYRACAFAFGQTGAGKTFTMLGNPKATNTREKQTGLIARSLEYLFQKLEAAGVQFSIKLSCLEIYHEQVFDLFAEEKDRLPLAVREHAADGFFIEGCKLVDCINFPVANAALDAAVRNRQTGSHDLNSRSSRSHCLTEIHIEIPVTVGEDGTIGGGVSYGDGGEVKQGGNLAQGEYVSKGKISLVDLAGSERLKSTKSTGKVLQEAGFINKSLYVLGKVIAGLIRTGGDLNHKDVPYRDSKLTKLLISSLGGRSRTLLISCVSEAKSNQAETLRTLKFSMSCARIRNKPMKFLDPQEKLILDLKEEIRRLRHENKKLRSNLLTAPASGEKMGGGRNSDDESSVMSRAYSAHSSLDKERLQFKPRNGGKIYGSKMNSSQSDYLKKLSPIKPRKSAGKPKREREMTKDQALRMLDDMRAATLARANANASTNHRADNDEESVGGGSVSSGKRQAAAEMEDLVRRRATGPMIFRGGSGIDISPVRETHPVGYAPAQNNMRTMDAMRIEELEKRIARMETGVLSHQQSFPHDHHAQARAELHTIAQANGAHVLVGQPGLYDGMASGYDGTALVGGVAVKKKKKKKGKAEEIPTVWKGKGKNSAASPYIAHLIEKAPKTAQDKAQFGVKIAAEDREGHMVTVTDARPVAAAPRPHAQSEGAASTAGIGMPRPAGRNSAEQLRAVVAAAETSDRPANKVKPAEVPPKSISKDLHSSILDELAELGLGPPSAAAPSGPADRQKKPAQKMTSKVRDREDSGSRSRARPAPAASQPMKPAASLPSLPPPAVDAAGNLSKPKNAAPVKKNPSLPPAKGKPAVLPPMQKEKPRASSASDAAPVTPLKKTATASDPSALKAKLETLEQSLAEEREKMEDNPGEVTAEAEEHYEELAKQAKMLRRKLEMSGVDLNVATDLNSSYDEEGAPTPEAVKLMARQMESINAPLPLKKNSSVPAGKDRDALVSPASSHKHGSTHASKKEKAETAPPAVTPIATKAATQDDEDDAYADEDFEDDAAKSKPSSAALYFKPAPKISLVTEVSRRFDPVDLIVPDIEQLTRSSTQAALKLSHAASNVSINTQPDEQFDVTTASDSMRHSAAAAVHQALSFVANEEPDFLGRLSASASFKKEPSYSDIKSRDKEESFAPSVKVAKKEPEPAAPETEDPYAEDTYDDDFVDADAEPASTRAKPAAFSPAPAVNNAFPARAVNNNNQSPSPTYSQKSSNDKPTGSRYAPEDDDQVNISPSVTPNSAPSVKSPVSAISSTPVATAPSSVQKTAAPVAAGAAANAEPDDAYEEDNYEDEFDADDGDLSPAKASAKASGKTPAPASPQKVPVPAPIVTAPYLPAALAKAEEDENFEYDLSSKKNAVSSARVVVKNSKIESPAPAANVADEPADDEYELDPTPVASTKVSAASPARGPVVTVPESQVLAPQAEVPAVVASPSKQQPAARAQSAPAEDEYAADEFDDYDVSFADDA